MAVSRNSWRRRLDINDASRSIKDSEIEQATANGIDYLEIPVAYDGLSVVINSNNDWVDYLTVEELQLSGSQGAQSTAGMIFARNGPVSL